MKTRNLLFPAFVLAALSAFNIASAQGTAFTYQGDLTVAGASASGTYDLAFTLYNTSTAGSAISGSVTNFNVAVSNGLFTATIDFGASPFTSTSSCWLQIAVSADGTNFTTLEPRQPLTSTPYAIVSQSAITAQNLANVEAYNTVAPGEYATIGGGYENEASGDLSTIGGGYGNYADGEYATIGGGEENISTNSGTIVGGGAYNSAGQEYDVVAGGYYNTANGPYATVGGGYGNTAVGPDTTAAGGYNNLASNYNATVGGGEGNYATLNNATVSGGFGNYATGDAATVCGGAFNIASGYAATVGGGDGNTASGNYSFAAGLNARAPYAGCFVWADSGSGSYSATVANQFDVRASGGIVLAGDVSLSGGASYHHLQLSGGNSTGYLYASYPALGDGVHFGYNYFYDANGGGHIINTGGGTSRISADYGEIILAVGAANAAPSTVRVDATTSGVSVYGTFNNSSDRNAKQDFAPVSPSEILDKVAQLPVSEWSYKTDASTRHIGPMGQDFYSSFNIGTDEKHIAPIDEGGVALAAIKGLNQKLENEAKEKDARIETLEKKLNELEAAMKQLAAQR
ncbi:MAG TPA: tail fiber domain-containing protein [Verrucomicrobiae bacterium]|jgi:hypothetical protein